MTKGHGSPPPSRILIADDNLQNLELLEAYMQDLPGVEVLRAFDGEEALEVIRREHPDLVLLDVMMPKRSGFEVCKTIKADPATQDIPVVMVTALNEPMDMERGLDCGTDDYLAKPIVREDLIDRVKSLLHVKHVGGSLDRSLAYMDDLENEPKGDEVPPKGDEVSPKGDEVSPKGDEVSPKGDEVSPRGGETPKED